MTVWFDMDGTLVDFYGVENWLDYLMESNPYPYLVAEPMMRFSTLAKRLNLMRKNGYKVGIISWLAKNSNDEFDALVTNAKLSYIKKHLPSVEFDEIHIVKYGTPKYEFADYGDVLFDDEMPNREAWERNGGTAYDVNNILEILKDIA